MEALGRLWWLWDGVMYKLLSSEDGMSVVSVTYLLVYESN